MIDITFLRRTTEKIFLEKDFQELLNSGKQLRIKYGVDVTAPFLHTGHAVNLWMMRWLQERGHKVVFLIGDFTTRIGDPTGKSKTRKVISREDIDQNAKEYIKQVSTVLLTDEKVFEVRRNSEWYDEMSMDELFKKLGTITHGQLVQRDMFQKRIENNNPIHMNEFLYPVLQGWDSVELKSDLTIVGNDQLFNEMMGRTFQTKEGQRPQVIITTKITPGTDGGEKQSKSLGNYIALADTPRNKYGKIMSLPDSLIMKYFEVYTDAPMQTIRELEQEMKFGGTNPMAIKKELAWWLVRRYHGEEVANQEKSWFKTAFGRRETPEDLQEVAIDPTTTVLRTLQLCLPEESNSHFYRLVKQGAIKVDGVLIPERDLRCTWAYGSPPHVLKIGKKHWFKIVWA